MIEACRRGRRHADRGAALVLVLAHVTLAALSGLTHRHAPMHGPAHRPDGTHVVADSSRAWPTVAPEAPAAPETLPCAVCAATRGCVARLIAGPDVVASVWKRTFRAAEALHPVHAHHHHACIPRAPPAA